MGQVFWVKVVQCSRACNGLNINWNSSLTSNSLTTRSKTWSVELSDRRHDLALAAISCSNVILQTGVNMFTSLSYCLCGNVVVSNSERPKFADYQTEALSCDSAWSDFVDFLVIYFGGICLIFIEESLWLLYFCDLIFYTIVYFYREGFNCYYFFKSRLYLSYLVYQGSFSLCLLTVI
jgi:hypothetical protein